ncbi:MAG TPA: magnesium transporter [Limnochordales bacterium]|nr:magnesium transporter [Limnochordales bacterium]
MQVYEELAAQVRQHLETADDEGLRALLLTLRPADVAEILAELPEGEPRGRVLALLEPAAAARVMEESSFDVQRDLLRLMAPERLQAVLERMSQDDLADMLGAMPAADARMLLNLIPEDAAAIRQLLRYDPDTAGGIMTPELVRLRETQTAAEALATIRLAAPDAETVYYLYVTDRAGRLVGVVSLRQLVVADPDTPVGELMDRNVVSVPVHMDQEEVARVLERYGLLALPVINDRHVLLGVVTVDDVIEVLREEATEDIHRLGATEPLEQPYLQTGFLSLVRARVFWLLLLFVLQSVTITIMNYYQAALERVIALAFFIPLLIGTAGNAGGQAATLVIRAMAVGELKFTDFFRVLWREATVGLTLGVVMALASLGRAAFMGTPAAIGVTVAVTVVLVVAVASVGGGLLPLVIQRLRLDPAVAASPLITTLADASGLIIYFTVAGWILGLSV